MNAKENLMRVIKRQSPEWVPYGMEATITLMPPVVERPETSEQDAFGVPWSYDAAAQGGTYPTAGQHPVADLREWRSQIQIPDVAALDWSQVAAQAKQIDRQQCWVQGFCEMGLFERTYLLLGMEQALMDYVSRPELMWDLVSALTDYKIDLISAFHEHVGLDLLWYGDDWGTERALFVPPEAWRCLIKPHLARIYEAAHERGILVNQHSCGHIEAIFGDMVELGADIWNPCQPCNDLAMLKRCYGDRICFSGGLDSQFVLGRPGVTEAEVRAEVRRRIDELADGGGYIAAPSHSVPYNPGLLAAMEQEIADYGRQCYAAR